MKVGNHITPYQNSYQTSIFNLWIPWLCQKCEGNTIDMVYIQILQVYSISEFPEDNEMHNNIESYKLRCSSIRFIHNQEVYSSLNLWHMYFIHFDSMSYYILVYAKFYILMRSFFLTKEFRKYIIFQSVYSNMI